MNKIIGKLLCTIKGYHYVELGNKDETVAWMETIGNAVHENGFAMLRCSVCGKIVAVVHDNEN